MREAGITHIELEAMADTADYAVTHDDAKMDSKSRARRIYFQAISAVDDIMGSAINGKSLRLAKSKRIVQGLIDQILSDPADLIGLTTLKCREKYTSNHPVNVCIISVLVGSRFDLPRTGAANSVWQLSATILARLCSRWSYWTRRLNSTSKSGRRCINILLSVSSC